MVQQSIPRRRSSRVQWVRRRSTSRRSTSTGRRQSRRSMPAAVAPPGHTPPQQSGGAGCPSGTPPTPPGLPHQGRHSDPWAPLDRSRKALPKLSLPSNYKSCSILDMQQILESWYDKSTFAIATWRGDAQRYWLTQVLDCARSRHDTWLQSTPSQRASLEPAYHLRGQEAYSRGTECS